MLSTVVSTRALAALRFTCRSVLLGALALSFSACNSGSSSAEHDRPPTTPPENPGPTMYSVGGTISGLNASGLVLDFNGHEINIDPGFALFTFPQKVAEGGSYQVTVATQPAGLTCTVGHGSGTNIAADVDDVAVVCSAVTYTISGSVTGLNTAGLVLQNNGADDLAVAANATSLQFATPVAHDGGYNVTVLTQPTGLVCSVSNGSGSHVAADVGNVQIVCSASTFPIGGTVSGLTTAGLVLQNNAGDNLPVPINASSFEFATPVAFGGGYNVTVLTQPVGMTCTVNDGSGTNVAAAVNDIDIVCSADTFDIGGSISGLSDSGLVLRNNGADDLAVPANATSFQFVTPVAYGGSYNATVQQQPTSQTCVVTDGSGTNVAANVTNIGISCSTNAHTVGGSLNGLVGTVVLQNNGGDDLLLNASGSFTFSTPVADGAAYNVTVLTQPVSQTCSITNGAGVMAASNVTNVDVSCSANAPTVSNISPPSGTASGGTLVTISGTHLTGVTSVTFSGNPGASLTVINDTTLTVITPANAVGAVDVTVTSAGGSATISNGFVYTP